MLNDRYSTLKVFKAHTCCFQYKIDLFFCFLVFSILFALICLAVLCCVDASTHLWDISLDQYTAGHHEVRGVQG